MSGKRKILYAVLNWGIGHATRSLPVLRELVRENDVTVMSTGRSLELLRSELPGIEFIDFPDYSVKYTNKGHLFILSMLVQVPKFLFRIRKENKFTEKLVTERGFDRIISDNRYGVFSKTVRSYLITHQVRFKLPKFLSAFEIFSELFCKLQFRNFTKIFIPDEKGGINLSGDLSHRSGLDENRDVSFIGILADLNGNEPEIESDYLFIISGPEPQRTLFEKKIFEQAKSLEGKKIIVRGITESDEATSQGGTEVYSSVKREKLTAMIRGAKVIISRPGYSSVMEFISCGKNALFVPTPGQTEQEYLARYFRHKCYFNFVPQEKMDLKHDLESLTVFKRPDLVPNKISGMLDEILS